MLTQGAALYSSDGVVMLNRVQVKNHTSGSAIYAVGGVLNVSHSIIEHNGKRNLSTDFNFTTAQVVEHTVLDLDFEDKTDKSGKNHHLIATNVELFDDENEYWSQKLSRGIAKDKCKSKICYFRVTKVKTGMYVHCDNKATCNENNIA